MTACVHRGAGHVASILVLASFAMTSVSTTAGAAPTPFANRSTAGFEAFRRSWNGVTNYAETIVAHETSNDGKDVQDRTYAYEFVKPENALIVITAGPGRGGAVAWHGGTTVRGHQGGFLAGIKLTLSKHDPRTVSLRGEAVDDASFGHEIDRYATIAGSLVDGTTTGGNVTLTLTPATPEPTGVTREMLTFASNGLPVKREQFVRDRRVLLETFSNVKLNDPKLDLRTIDFERSQVAAVRRVFCRLQNTSRLWSLVEAVHSTRRYHRSLSKFWIERSGPYRRRDTSSRKRCFRSIAR